MSLAKAVKLLCSHPGCNTPIAERQGNVLLIRSRHHGEKHINVVETISVKQESADAGRVTAS